MEKKTNYLGRYMTTELPFVYSGYTIIMFDKYSINLAIELMKTGCNVVLSLLLCNCRI